MLPSSNGITQKLLAVLGSSQCWDSYAKQPLVCLNCKWTASRDLLKPIRYSDVRFWEHRGVVSTRVEHRGWKKED